MVVDRIASFGSGALRGGWVAAQVAHRIGLTTPVRPDRLVAMGMAMHHWGRTPAGLYAANAARDPDGIAVIDERESVTFAEIDHSSSAVAAALAERGVGAGDAVALLARNSSAFMVAMVAISKLGADTLYADTGFAVIGHVLKSEHAAAIVADDEFREIVEEHAGSLPRLWAWDEADDAPDDSVAGIVAAAGDDVPDLPSPGAEGRHVILTSGTTGKPRGAARSSPTALSSLVSAIAFLDAIPYRAQGVTVLAAPAFHAWALGNVTIGMILRSTFVMTRRFDPAVTLALVEEHGADDRDVDPLGLHLAQQLIDRLGSRG